MYVDEKKTTREIGEMFGVSQSSAYERVRELGIKTRSLSEAYAFSSPKNVDENFFSAWSAEMAYVLGWVLSDGNLTKGTGFRLAVNDEEVLQKIASAMELTNGVSVQNRYDGKNSQFVLSICRRKIYDDLVALGVQPGNRTFTQEQIFIPEDFERHFIRGFFDGDGSVVIRHRPNRRIEVVLCKSSEKLVDQIINILYRHLGVHVGKTTVHLKSGNNSYRIVIGSQQAVEKFYRWIYHDVSNRLWLERKYEKFESYFGFIEEVVESDKSTMASIVE